MQLSDNEIIENFEDSKATVLTVLPENEDAVARLAESDADDAFCNTVNLSVRTSALSVQLQTKTAHSHLIAELTTKLECALARIVETDDRLTNAVYRIGYLECQLAEKEKLLTELKQSN